MKSAIAIVVLVLLGVGAYFLFMNQPKKTDNSQVKDNNQTQPMNNETTKVSDHPVATIETSMGTIVIKLDHTAAPKTVENFVKLANDGFYNNLKFHRVVADFVIQAGDPKGDGTGGPGFTVPAEIKLTHELGAIGMASTGAGADSNGSQFYITVADNANTRSLDGKYTIFGYVTSGMDIAQKISKIPVEPGDFPLQDVVIKKITIQD